MSKRSIIGILAKLGFVASCASPVDSTTESPSAKTTMAPVPDVSSNPSCAGCLLGPITVQRTAGPVRTETWQFTADAAADYLLEIRSSGGAGNQAEVDLNGATFKVRSNRGVQTAAATRIPVALNSLNALSVRVHGAPDEQITVMIHAGIRTINATGGTVRAPGGHSVVVPPGALSAPTELQIIPTTLPSIDPAMVAFASPMLSLLPDGITFAIPVSLRIAYDPQVQIPAHIVAVQYLPSDNLLGFHDSALDTDAGVVVLPLSHFSQYTLVQSGVLTTTKSPYRYRLFGCPPKVGGTRFCGNFRFDLSIAFQLWRASARSVDVEFAESFGASDIDIRFGTWSSSFTDVVPGLAGWEVSTGKRTIVLSSDQVWWDVNGTSFGAPGIVNLSRVLSHEIGHFFGIPDQPQSAVMSDAFLTAPISLRCSELGKMGGTYSVPALGVRCMASLTTVGTVPGFGYPMSLSFAGSTLRAVDVSGNPVEGVPILNRVTGGGGSIFNKVMPTNPTGTTELIWRLGSQGGQQNTLQAFVPNIAGATMTFSVTTFSLPSFVAAPVLTSPSDRSAFSNIPRTVTVSWEAVAGATGYEVEVEACFIWELPAFWTCEPALLSYLSGVVAVTELTFTHVGVQPGRWHVRARDVNGTPGPWSEWRHFRFTQ